MTIALLCHSLIIKGEGAIVGTSQKTCPAFFSLIFQGIEILEVIADLHYYRNDGASLFTH